MSPPALLLAREPVRARVPWRRAQFRSHSGAQPYDLEHSTLGPETILRLQRQAGNAAVTELLTGGLSSFTNLAAVATELLSQALASGIEASQNHLTDELFYKEYPKLRGEKLHAGSPEAMRWLRIRDTVVRPMLRSHPKRATPDGSTPAAGESHGPAGMVPVDQVAAGSGGSSAGGATMAAAKTASTGDKYFVQDVGRYRDVDEAGKPRVWANGSSGMNICNMTTLTMGLVSMHGEAEVRSKIIALLRSKGMHAGASVQVGGKWLPLADALGDPKVADRIDLLDLVTAAAIGEHGNYQDVTVPGTIAHLARESGLATKAETVRGQPRLATEKGRALAQEMLASGKRVLAGTVHHYVYLIEVRDDGVVVHDPAGARVEPGLKGPVFLHGGTVRGIAREWGNLDSARRERAVRRVSTNAEVAAIVNRLAEIWSLEKNERESALTALAKEHSGHIATGPSNFYAASEFSENDLRLVVSLA